jgi:hypothetical protein
MSDFEDRKGVQETKFQLDQELEFKAQARRAKLVGLWAAGLLGQTEDEAAAYAKSVVLADLEESGEEDLFRKIRTDFDRAGVQQSDHQIRIHMAQALEDARAQVREGK